MNVSSRRPEPSAVRLVAVGVAWVVVYFVSRTVLRTADLSPPVRVGVALAPVVPFVFVLLTMIAGIRSLDELHRRVHLEALTFAFPSAMVLLMALGLLQLAIPELLARFPLRDIWPLLPLLYFVGLAMSWRHYR